MKWTMDDKNDFIFMNRKIQNLRQFFSLILHQIHATWLLLVNLGYLNRLSIFHTLVFQILCLVIKQECSFWMFQIKSFLIIDVKTITLISSNKSGFNAFNKVQLVIAYKWEFANYWENLKEVERIKLSRKTMTKGRMLSYEISGMSLYLLVFNYFLISMWNCHFYDFY